MPDCGVIPDCSGGSEIKTSTRVGHRAAYSDTRLLRGERDQNIAATQFARHGRDTKLLRGERDQNGIVRRTACSDLTIPDCSGGSEIKTTLQRIRLPMFGIPDCSGGSEIKTLMFELVPAFVLNTRLLRGERDQNVAVVRPRSLKLIPDCSGGSEIKTRPCRGTRATTQIPNCSGGSEIKTSRCSVPISMDDTKLLRGERDQNRTRIETRRESRYQIAPGGARSKLRNVA